MTDADGTESGVTESAPTHWLTRFVFLRLLGLIYVTGFAILVNQVQPLIGTDGLLPAHLFLERVENALGPGWPSISQVPSLFWWKLSDTWLLAGAWLGLALSVVVLFGGANGLILAILWVLYQSYVNVGQLFYGYGWETLLLETGFLAIFAVHPWRIRPFERGTPMPRIVVWLLRWLAFRLMFGAGLIKIRGDECWRDLTCLVYHYETQPNPGPLSRWFHFQPVWFHNAGTLFNHFVELVVPWFLLLPALGRGMRRRVCVALRHWAGGFAVLFQVILIISGNLAFLNWLTLAVCTAAWDDSFYRRLTQRLRWPGIDGLGMGNLGRPRQVAVVLLALMVAIKSIDPVSNMLSPGQRMNTSFDALNLVNSYGAFGSVGKKRPELVIEGTADDPDDPDAAWLAYALPCAPGPLDRAPCLITPYHLRFDWQIWFAAMSSLDREPWLVHLMAKLLQNDPGALSQFAVVPFADQPPRAVRISRYLYRFADPRDETGAIWVREPLDAYMRPITWDDPDLVRVMERQRWPRD